jgi:hypothetical protein
MCVETCVIWLQSNPYGLLKILKKVLYAVTLYGKYTMALTFQNCTLCQMAC